MNNGQLFSSPQLPARSIGEHQRGTGKLQDALLTFLCGGSKTRRQTSTVADMPMPAGAATSQLPADRKFIAVGRVALYESMMGTVRHPRTRRSHRRRTTERCKYTTS